MLKPCISCACACVFSEYKVEELKLVFVRPVCYCTYFITLNVPCKFQCNNNVIATVDLF